MAPKLKYTWVANPVVLHEGLLIISATCAERPSQRPCTDAEWKDYYDDHITVKPHEIPAWFATNEAALLKCIKPEDTEEAKRALAAARAAIGKGDKDALLTAANLFRNLAHKYPDSPMLRAMGGCSAREYAGQFQSHLETIRLNGSYE